MIRLGLPPAPPVEPREVPGDPAVLFVGGIMWQFETDGPIYYSSPVVGSDGTIYVGSRDDNLFHFINIFFHYPIEHEQPTTYHRN